MRSVDRRRFLQLAGGTAALAALPTSIARAASIPAARRTGTISDVEHIVVLMQENRSFDHFFGKMRGVRGFGDPHPVTLPSGKPVWNQSDGAAEILPFRPDMENLGQVFIEDLDHSWNGTHEMFNGGNWDEWIPSKTSTTMAYLRRSDLPFHYALADAFTICDGYHCSILSATDPNRYYLWTGWVGNDGRGGGPVIANDELGYTWTTYPERLQKAGVSWKVYQDVGDGLDAAGYWGWTGEAPYIGNYGDNSLLYFTQYQNAPAGSPLAERARTGTDNKHGQDFFQILAADVKADRLPQVSYVVAPEAFTEHPNWPANYGAWYTAKVLDALTANPDVWSKTVLLVTYDENDGFFDHVVSPYPAVGGLAGGSTVSTANELYQGQIGTPGGSTGVVGPYGLGVRVPMVAVSPWSTGGWVCSEVFDHTSVIRFIEQRFGVAEPNITPWRRTVSGDLTSAFDFSRSRPARPALPGTARFEPTDDQRHPDYHPTPPANPLLPKQETGYRPSRALGYDLEVDAVARGAQLALTVHNRGSLGAAVQARSNLVGGPVPASYTVEAGKSLAGRMVVGPTYDVSVHGPNGFFRRFAGQSAVTVGDVSARASEGKLSLTVTNRQARSAQFRVANVYTGIQRVPVAAGKSATVSIPLSNTGGWYDVTVTADGVSGFARGFAGRVETGRPSISDPQLGG